MSKKLLALLSIVALVGFIDATYLSAEHYLGLIPPCTLLQGCEKVTTSAYSVIAGVSVAVPGALYYFVVLVLIGLLLQTSDQKYLKYLAHVSWAGLAAAIYFTAVQAFIIHAYCQYCLLSALSSTILFILAQYAWRQARKKTRVFPEPLEPQQSSV